VLKITSCLPSPCTSADPKTEKRLPSHVILSEQLARKTIQALDLAVLVPVSLYKAKCISSLQQALDIPILDSVQKQEFIGGNDSDSDSDDDSDMVYETPFYSPRENIENITKEINLLKEENKQLQRKLAWFKLTLSPR